MTYQEVAKELPYKCPYKQGVRCDKLGGQSCYERKCPILFPALKKRDER
jgi:hypothetical protein